MNVELLHEHPNGADKYSLDVYSFVKDGEFLHLEIYDGVEIENRGQPLPPYWAITWKTKLPFTDVLNVARNSCERLNEKYIRPSKVSRVSIIIPDPWDYPDVIRTNISGFLNPDNFDRMLKERNNSHSWVRVETEPLTYYIAGGEYGMIGSNDLAEEMLIVTQEVSPVALSEEEFSYVRTNLHTLVGRFPKLRRIKP